MIQHAIDVEIGSVTRSNARLESLYGDSWLSTCFAHVVIALGKPIEARLQLVPRVRPVHGAAEVACRLGESCGIIGRMRRRPIGMDFLVEAVRRTVEPFGRRSEAAGRAAARKQQRRNQECRCAFHLNLQPVISDFHWYLDGNRRAIAPG